jgi:acyl carrier protein
VTEPDVPQAMPQLSEHDLTTWLQANIASLLEVDPATIGVDDAFDSYGLGSSDAVFLTGGLSELAGMRLSATLAWDFPTIRELSAFLAAVFRGEAELPDDQIDWDLDTELFDIQ